LLPLLNFQAFFNFRHGGQALLSPDRCSGWPSHPAISFMHNKTKGITDQQRSAKSANGLIKDPWYKETKPEPIDTK
jgi:hypothetical protein